MRYHVLATDYDGTLAKKERVSPEVVERLKALKTSGRKLILVTGRQLGELQALFPESSIFDRIVAENGALIYRPATMDEKLLGEPPPSAFIQKLKAHQVSPLAIGRVIVATWEPHQAVVLDAIKESGLEYQVIFNKGAVMVLPPGINKAKGLHEALKELGISEHNVVAIGDAENDNALLKAAEFAVAVQNALPQVKINADWTTEADHGDGVAELIAQLLKDDLLSMDSKISRHFLELGQCFDNSSFRISPYGNSILLSGTSGAGKTTFVVAFLEKLIAEKYQFCLIDPEGDYLDLSGMVNIGDSSQPPLIEQVIQSMCVTLQNVVVNTLAIPLNDRPLFFKQLLTALVDLRKNTGHPHFIIMDEAHHLAPSQVTDSFFNFPEDFKNFVAITTQPELINAAFLKRINIALIIGDTPEASMAEFASLTDQIIEVPESIVLQKGELLVWQKNSNKTMVIKSMMPSHLLRRHKRKYATGDMGPDSFYFKGPASKLNLKANNLMIFIQMASGIDDETWVYHLKRNDYSNWFNAHVNDEELATKARKIEQSEHNPEVSRNAIFKLIQERYTSPG